MKFNRAFEVCRVVADCLSSTSSFEANLEVFEKFSGLLCSPEGLPSDIRELIDKHTNKQSSVTETDAPVDSDVLVSTMNNNELHENCREIVEHSEMIPDDMVIYKIKGFGACFYSSCAAHIYKDENQSGFLRILGHNFIVNNWWYFRDYFPLPFIATIGVGGEYQTMYIEDENELHSFLLSEKSLKCWSDSQVR